MLLQDIVAAIGTLQTEIERVQAAADDAATAFLDTERVTEKAIALAFSAITLLEQRASHLGSFRSKMPLFLKKVAKLKRMLDEQTRQHGASN